MNEKYYIGKSHCPKNRWRDHKKAAEKGFKNAIYNAIRKYGIENFEFSILHKCRTEKRAFLLEMFYIRIKNTLTPNGYNMTTGGEGVSGGILRTEHRLKISHALKGKKKPPFSIEHRSNISKARIGIKRGPRNQEIRNKISAAQKGRTYSEKTIENMRIGQQNRRPFSLEHRRKIRVSNTGKKRSERSKENMRKAAKNRKRPPPFSPEHKNNLIRAALLRPSRK